MTIDIENWIKKCVKCQKVGKPLSAPPSLQFVKVSAAWELVAIDIIGPFPETVDGFQYILTATDYFSKWVEAFPLKTKSVAEAGRHICSMICRYGCPKRILSDQGKEFVDQLNDQMCSILGIERSETAAYHPQTNGLDDKTNNNIKRVLTKLVKEKQNNWDVCLDATLFSIRSKVQTTTKYSPFLLMYGREAVFPAEVPVDMPLSAISLPEEQSYTKFLEERESSMEAILEATLENIAKSQEKQEMANAKKAQKHESLIYNLGDELSTITLPEEHSYATFLVERKSSMETINEVTLESIVAVKVEDDLCEESAEETREFNLQSWG
ncbi:SH3-containing GRB2 3-interacting 1 [Pelobates cultripes]|uniref:SH3-containing GRB2 3-interacting 1 n=2 Tax=Pelobates cultripes TaxID=61616 RepID=A0AAD1SRU3_PELCU|nr:SH3-containing GRB2 3-interacting 1 [Pelobates cultripes]